MSRSAQVGRAFPELRLGWFLDPDDKAVVVSPADTRSRPLRQDSTLLPVPPWVSEFRLTVGELFSGLRCER